MPSTLHAELGRRLTQLPWPAVTDREPTIAHEQPDLRDHDLIGGAMWIRGEWRGVVVVRCDRRLALEMATRLEERGPLEDRGVHWLLRQTFEVVVEMLDRQARATDWVSLAGAEIFWFPASCTVRMRAALWLGSDAVCVEVYERKGWQPPPV